MSYDQLCMKYIIPQNIIIFIKNRNCKSGIISIPAVFRIFIMFPFQIFLKASILRNFYHLWNSLRGICFRLCQCSF